MHILVLKIVFFSRLLLHNLFRQNKKKSPVEKSVGDFLFLRNKDFVYVSNQNYYWNESILE